jgi:hypothetical protein
MTNHECIPGCEACAAARSAERASIRHTILMTIMETAPDTSAIGAARIADALAERGLVVAPF